MSQRPEYISSIKKDNKEVYLQALKIIQDQINSKSIDLEIAHDKIKDYLFSDQELQEVMQRIKVSNEQKKELITSNKKLNQLRKSIKNQIENIVERIKQVEAKIYLNNT